MEDVRDADRSVTSLVQQMLFFWDCYNNSVNDTNKKRKRGEHAVDAVRDYFQQSGFRCPLVTSPTLGLSVYKVRRRVSEPVNGEAVCGNLQQVVLEAMLGIHENQTSLEDFYKSHYHQIYSLSQYCRRLKTCCNMRKDTDSDLTKALESGIQQCQSALSAGKRLDVPKIRNPIDDLHQEKGVFRRGQLDHEWERISESLFSTLSNSLLQSFVDFHQCSIQNVLWKPFPGDSQYERFTIFLHESKRPASKTLCWLPQLTSAIKHGSIILAQMVVDTFWHVLLTQGYFASSFVKNQMTPLLSQYIHSGIMETTSPMGSAAELSSKPFSLRAHFEPRVPLSFYFWGAAGTGKSSLVRHMCSALQVAIRKHLDGSTHVSWVKQNLNKPLEKLELEFELRPNNNDLSVMSIVQGRRMALQHTQPGLVVLALEEMAPSKVGNSQNPHQEGICELLSQRFAGRKGKYHSRAHQTRNADKGLSGDSSIIPLFTSNYCLESNGHEALAKLDMFRNLHSVEMKAITGSERQDFAMAYFRHCLRERLSKGDIFNPSLDAQIQNLDFPSEHSNDTRPLIRYLSFLAFHVSRMVEGKEPSTLKISVQKDGDSHFKVSVNETCMSFVRTSSGNLMPRSPAILQYGHTRTVFESLRKLPGKDPAGIQELGLLVEAWLQKVLAPVVVLSSEQSQLDQFSLALEECLKNQATWIRNINAATYPLIKSLYDDTPNLRSDILTAQQKNSFVVIEVTCPTLDDQLLMRELLEDSPSRTAFSTAQSALYKEGLLFLVHTPDEISPEIQSRASFVIKS